jgi:hypothetical protein
VAVTATFQLFYVLVLIEHDFRRLVHSSITQHPTAAWTLQQLRKAIGCEDVINMWSAIIRAAGRSVSDACKRGPTLA